MLATIEKLDQNQQLEQFEMSLNAMSAWNSDDQQPASHEARLCIELDDERYTVLARRYDQIGHKALKVSFWQNIEEDHKFYMGAVGYHHQDAVPYCRLTTFKVNEELLYAILDSVSTEV